MPHDLLVVSKLKNRPLRDAVREAGLTLKQISEKAGVCTSHITSFGCLSASPYYIKTGCPKPAAESLAEFFEIPVETLFPRLLYKLQFPKVIERTIDAEQAISLLEARKQKLLPESFTPEYQCDPGELAISIGEALDTLTNRERLVIEMRFGVDGKGSTGLREVGEHFGVSVERIRQIEAKALRKLRHPSRSSKLKGFLERGHFYYDPNPVEDR